MWFNKKTETETETEIELTSNVELTEKGKEALIKALTEGGIEESIARKIALNPTLDPEKRVIDPNTGEPIHTGSRQSKYKINPRIIKNKNLDDLEDLEEEMANITIKEGKGVVCQKTEKLIVKAMRDGDGDLKIIKTKDGKKFLKRDIDGARKIAINSNGQVFDLREDHEGNMTIYNGKNEDGTNRYLGDNKQTNIGYSLTDEEKKDFEKLGTFFDQNVINRVTNQDNQDIKKTKNNTKKITFRQRMNALFSGHADLD